MSIEFSKTNEFLLQLKSSTNERLIEVFQIYSHKKLSGDLKVQFQMLKDEYKLRTEKSMEYK